MVLCLRCSITSTFDEETAKSLIGTKLPRNIVRVQCDNYDYTVPETSNLLRDGFEKCVITAEDHFAAGLIIYQSLNYPGRNEVEKILFNGIEKHDNEKMHEFFAKLSDAQFAFLVGEALLHKSDSQYPHNITSYFLYKLAERAGVDVKGIEEEQKEKAEVRTDR
jgi:hypothetical protein